MPPSRPRRHEWACFAAHQAAEKAARALHLRLGQEAWGHVIAQLLSELPESLAAPGDLIERARALDNFYVPTRYPNGHTSGAPFEHYGHSRVSRRPSMPVRSLRSSVFTWPDAATVDAALGRWAADAASRHGEVLRIGYFGSYARGDWGVGSDIDVVILLQRCDVDFLERARSWDLARLPVPAEVVIYTRQEFATLRQKHDLTVHVWS